MGERQARSLSSKPFCGQHVTFRAGCAAVSPYLNTLLMALTGSGPSVTSYPVGLAKYVATEGASGDYNVRSAY